jgi:hypothetical protein
MSSNNTYCKSDLKYGNKTRAIEIAEADKLSTSKSVKKAINQDPRYGIGDFESV